MTDKAKTSPAAKSVKPSGVHRYQITAAIAGFEKGDVPTLSATRAKALGLTSKNSRKLKGH
tara:strand:+ start:191 stop:373 length:183 start_codon:yes stop_codon:yes gene_type:complete